MDFKSHHIAATAIISNRKFGFTVGGVLLLLGALPLLQRHPPLWSLISVGAALVLSAWIFPAALGPVNRLWMAFGDRLHRLVSPLILAVVFFAVVTPVSLIRRLFTKDPLQLRFRPDLPSYWQQRAQGEITGPSLKNLF